MTLTLRAIARRSIEIAGRIVTRLGLAVAQLRLAIAHVRSQVAVTALDIAVAGSFEDVLAYIRAGAVQFWECHAAVGP